MIMSNMITIPIEEYNDLCKMKDFIYDNGLVFQYEMFLDILAQISSDEETETIIDIKTEK